MRVKISWVPILAVLAAAAPAFGQQASLTLKDSKVVPCHHNETSWTLAKTGSLSGSTVTWTVTATKGATTDSVLSGDGFVRIQNTGSADATIGNIVVNLQRKYGKQWKTQSSDVANATSGDAATKAKIVSGASSEGLSCFEENAASGTLVFTDANSDSIFSLVPQLSLPAGAVLDLFFQANFNNTILGIPAGEAVRFEVIVSFGNSGKRGGSGASGTNIDINGNSVLDADEACVRSVPTRLTVTVPALEECGKEVALLDQAGDVTTTGTVTFSGFSTTIGEGSGYQVLSASGSFTVSVEVDPGADGGSITNTAHLDSAGEDVVVPGPIIDPLTGEVEFVHVFECCPGIHLEASSKVDIGAVQHTPRAYTTYSQGGWGSPTTNPNGHNPGHFLAARFAAVYPLGVVEVGTSGADFWMRFTTAAAIEKYLPAGGPAKSLDANHVNPENTHSGVFGGQVLALQLSVDFSAAGETAAGLGDLVYHLSGSDWDGMSVKQILAAANAALGSGNDNLPDGLNALVANLNLAFDNGVESAWATAHLGT
jgi:hypothetical protein